MMGTTNIMKQSIFPSGASGGKHSSEHTDRTQTGNKNLDLHPSSAPHQLLNLNLAFYIEDYSMFGNNKDLSILHSMYVMLARPRSTQ